MEVGPGDVLSGMTYECGADRPCVSLPTLRTGEPEPHGLMRAVAGAWVRGVGVDWAAVYAESGARTVDLPTYAFQHRRYWRGTQHYWCGSTEHIAPLAEPTTEPAEISDTNTEFRAQVLGLAEPERYDLVLATVCTQIAAILVDRADDGEIDQDTGVLATGLTSLSVLELRNRMNALAGSCIPVDGFLDNPTPRALAALVLAELSDDVRVGI